MKKLLLITLVAVAGLVALDATARSRDCGSCQVKAPCAKPCEKYVKTVEVIDNTHVTPPCCERYVRVEERPICHEIITKDCVWSCPSSCNTVEGRSQFHDEAVEAYPTQTTRIIGS